MHDPLFGGAAAGPQPPSSPSARLHQRPSPTAVVSGNSPTRFSNPRELPSPTHFGGPSSPSQFPDGGPGTSNSFLPPLNTTALNRSSTNTPLSPSGFQGGNSGGGLLSPRSASSPAYHAFQNQVNQLASQLEMSQDQTLRKSQQKEQVLKKQEDMLHTLAKRIDSLMAGQSQESRQRVQSETEISRRFERKLELLESKLQEYSERPGPGEIEHRSQANRAVIEAVNKQMDERLSRMDAVISTFREQVISQGQKVQTNTLSSQDRMIEFEKRLETFREQIVKKTKDADDHYEETQSRLNQLQRQIGDLQRAGQVSVEEASERLSRMIRETQESLAEEKRERQREMEHFLGQIGEGVKFVRDGQAAFERMVDTRLQQALKDFRLTQDLTNKKLEDSINAGLARLENAMRNTTSKLNDTAETLLDERRERMMDVERLQAEMDAENELRQENERKLMELVQKTIRRLDLQDS